MRLFLFLTCAFVLVSCSEFNKRGNNKSWATGKPGEIMVVCTDHLWLSAEMDSMLVRLSPPEEPYFPLEYAFNFSQRNALGFNSTFKPTRNVLIIEVQDSLSKPYDFYIEKDKWSIGQTVVQLNIKGGHALGKLDDEVLAEIRSAFEQGELDRNVERFRAKSNAIVKDMVLQKFGFQIDFPKGVRVLNDVDNFLRIDVPDRSREMPLDGGPDVQTSRANFIVSSSLLWEQVYESEKQFELLELLRHQDTILKKYAPHEKEGAYLTTEYDTVVYPLIQKLDINGVEVYEIKGQYRIGGRNDVFMGGPFVSYSFLNHKTNKIVTLFGMVHGPSERLLTYIREHKSLIRTMKL